MSIYKLVARLKLSIAIEQQAQFFAELFLALGQALRPPTASAAQSHLPQHKRQLGYQPPTPC